MTQSADFPEDVLNDIDALKIEWRRIVRDSRQNAHAVGSYMSSLFRRLREDEEQLKRFAVAVLGEHPNTAKAHLERVRAYVIFPGVAIWRAVAWKGVRQIMRCGLTVAQKKFAARSVVSTARRYGGVVPKNLVNQVLAEAGVVKTPKAKGKSKIEMQRDALLEQVNAAIDDELLSRGLLRQIFSEDMLRLLSNFKESNSNAPAAADPEPAVVA